MATEPENRPEDQEATPDAAPAADGTPLAPDAPAWMPAEQAEPPAEWVEQPPAEEAVPPAEEAAAVDLEPDPEAEAAAAAVAAAVATLAAGRNPGKTPRQPKPAKPPKAPKKPKAPKPARQGRSRVDIRSWFTVPAKRLRLVIWVGVLVIAVLGVMVVALGVTSSYWFCANGCHKVQDDTIIAYNRTAHSKISCMACHMPVNATAVTFMLHKVTALGELFLTITDLFELPLNPEDEVAHEMPEEQCTQCHSDTRPITPTPGIEIDHEAHSSRGIVCTICHNRTAHIEDFKLVLATDRKHEYWMTMEACFRCHNLDPKVKAKVKGLERLSAPGKCSTCHPPEFPLEPDNHKVGADFQKTHPVLVKLKGKAYCLMCHNEKTFCIKCHGLPMPHPSDFKTLHGQLLKGVTVTQDVFRANVCQRCHGAGVGACSNCHHKYPGYDPAVPWIKQHPLGAASLGPRACFKCHPVEFCPLCHVAIGKARLKL